MSGNSYEDIEKLSEDLTRLFVDRKRVQMDWKTACELFVAASRYRELQLECLSALRSSLNIANVCEALSICASSKDLKECIQEFLKGHFEAVSRTASWKELNERDPKLVNEILINMLKAENYVFC